MSEFDPFGRFIFVDNEFRPASSAAFEPVINPANLALEGEVAQCDQAECERVIACANNAQSAWARLDEKNRATLLHRVADSIEQTDFHDVAYLMVQEMGKPYPEATGELANCAPIFRYYAELARDNGGVMPGTTQAGSFQFARYFPYGVSAHIMPFNFPVLILCWTVAASLAAGNACVAKPAAATSLCTLKFMEHFKALPAGLVNCVTGGASTGAALTQSPNTHVVAFTGGVSTAREVAVACAEHLKPAVIEAGGSDAMIISEHAPLDVAVPGTATAAFHLSGQICTSSERIFVAEAIHDEFVERLTAAARALRIGPGLEHCEIGPLVNEAARDKVVRLVSQALHAGASCACGGRIPPDRDVGWFYEPTILTDVTIDMDIMREETFGPVAAVCKVANFEQAIEFANDSEFGLGACVFTSRLDEAMHAYDTLQAGMVWVNNPLIDNDAVPFGGWKLSGVGRELGRLGLDSFRQSKMGIIDAAPTVQEWWYPYPDDWFYAGQGRKF